MSLGDENMVMPVAPTNAFGGDMGGNGWWIILLFILLFGAGGFGGNGMTVQNGFNQAAVTTGLSDIQNTISNNFAQAEIADNSRQIANMQQNFAMQTAMNSGFNGLQSQLAQCCCDNRLATANLQSVIMSENCADRAAISDGLRDILVSNNANTQRILDTMCQDKIDAKNERIAELERQLTIANLAASQNAQTGTIIADNAAQTLALEKYLNPTPIPAYIVANPNTGTTTTNG